jgi:succinyl-diaminopimelate desuccinylase
MSGIRDRVIELTQELVRRSNPAGYDTGGQKLLAERLARLGFRSETVKLDHCENLIAFRGEGDEYFAFVGHTDVVAPGDGWSVDPFKGVIRDGRLYGRGVADMKGSVAAWVVALEDFIRENPSTKLPLALLIAGDEEVESLGMPAMLARLESAGKSVKLCLVGEPTATDSLGDCVKAGRRGSLSAKVIVKGVQGHVAYPHLAKNPNHAVARIISRLTRVNLDDGLPPLPLSEGDVGWPASSLQISSISSGTGGGTNVIPGEAEFRFNIRYRVPLTRDKLVALLTPMIEDDECEVSVVWSAGSNPYDSDAGMLRVSVIEALRKRGFSPSVTRDGGTSDGRFVAQHGAEVLELGPCNKTIHKVDEHLKVEELEQLVLVYRDVLERVAKAWML